MSPLALQTEQVRSPDRPRIGLLSGDRELAGQLRTLGSQADFTLTYTTLQDAFLELTKSHMVDLALIDAAGDGVCGLEACEALRRQRGSERLPVIMLTAQGDEPARLSAFEAGVDDCVTVPFSARELTARIGRILSRAMPTGSGRIPSDRDVVWAPLGRVTELTYDDLVMELATARVSKRGVPVRLLPSEFKILRALMRCPEKVLSRQTLLQAICDDPACIDIRTVDVYVRRVRRALESASPGHLIRTVRSAGYSLDRDGSD